MMTPESLVAVSEAPAAKGIDFHLQTKRTH